MVTELNLHKTPLKPNRLRTVYNHRGAHVTSLCWSGNGSQVFSGDDRGRVVATRIFAATVRYSEYSETCLERSHIPDRVARILI